MVLGECNFDIMGVCETFIESNVAGNEISIDGYSIVKKDRMNEYCLFLTHKTGTITYIGPYSKL